MILYHNPQCSKSRATLALLQEKGVEVSIIEYLKTPLTIAELDLVAQKLGLQPREFMRHSEAEYAHVADENLTREQLLDAIVKHPRLLERPIAVTGMKAAIGRPPENVLTLL